MRLGKLRTSAFTRKILKMSKVPGTAFRRQIISLIPVYMNALIMGCGAGWIPNSLYYLTSGEEVQATSSQCALIASFSIFGRLAFAIPAGILADKYGRKQIIVGVAFLHTLAWLGLSLDTSLISIYIGRFVIGLAEALINATALVSIGENASSEVRGRLSSVYQISLNFGGIIASILSLTFSSYKLLTWSIAFLSTLSLFSMFWVSETPSFLISISKFKQAKKNLSYIRQGYQKHEIDNEFEKLKTYIKDEGSRRSRLSFIKFIKSKSIQKPLLIGILANCFSKLTGGVLVKSYITILIPRNDYIPRRFFPLIIQIIVVLVSFNTALYIDKFPRKTVIQLGTACAVFFNALCAISDYFIAAKQYNDIFNWIFVLGNILSLLCYTSAIQPVTNVLKSELYPQSVKGLCISLGAISQSLTTIFLYQLCHLTAGYFHLYDMYIVFAISCIIFYFLIHRFMPEGRGASLMDLQMAFKEPNTSDDNSVAKFP